MKDENEKRIEELEAELAKYKTEAELLRRYAVAAAKTPPFITIATTPEGDES